VNFLSSGAHITKSSCQPPCQPISPSPTALFTQNHDLQADGNNLSMSCPKKRNHLVNFEVCSSIAFFMTLRQYRRHDILDLTTYTVLHILQNTLFYIIHNIIYNIMLPIQWDERTNSQLHEEVSGSWLVCRKHGVMSGIENLVWTVQIRAVRSLLPYKSDTVGDNQSPPIS
jgi:hypothetical protein